MRILLGIILLLPLIALGQAKKSLDHSAYSEWRKFDQRYISNDGKYVVYTTSTYDKGNSIVSLIRIDGMKVLSYERGSSAVFSNNSQYVVFRITQDEVEKNDMRRKKVKEDKMPKDTLAIYHIPSGTMKKVAGLQSFKVPEKWDDYVFYLQEPERDTSKAAKKLKKFDKKNGFDLVVYNLREKSDFHFGYVLDYAIPEEGPGLALSSTGDDKGVMPGIYRFDFAGKAFKPMHRAKGKYYQMVWDKKGRGFSFVSDTDTTKALKRDYHLQLWTAGQDSSATLAANRDLKSLNVNHQSRNYFSESGKRLFFEVKELPVLQDTSLLKEEIVNVEVWTTNDVKLYTEQEITKDRDLKFGYLSYYDLASKRVVQLGGPQFTDVEISDRGDGSTAFGIDTKPYQYLRQWEGDIDRDFYTIDVATGKATLVAKGVEGNINFSPMGKYTYWYNEVDSAWRAFSFASGRTITLTSNDAVPFYDEIFDIPTYPGSYGILGWSENDARILIYDRYDIWEVDPMNPESRKRITPNGRAEQLTYRYVKLDPEERFIRRNQDMILSGFYYRDKHEAVFSYRYGSTRVRQLTSGDFSYGNLLKARNSNNMIFTRENFRTFPDLVATDITFKSTKRITDLNPQQQQYTWGNAELVRWKTPDGEEMEGMLYKPDNFDPSKKYPMMVNFYERSADRLNSYHSPAPGRTSINYSFYISRGYVLFNPDVHYKTGHPGESAYNCVVSGVQAVLDKGFVDPKRIGVQGHSWGGYQIAYLITRTNLFACAESGAPVANMTSAYGGIRWGSGMNRMFQYERTQSRIGEKLWDAHDLYIENSPLFKFDKVSTPVLILHNDGDDAVPWYQGIEMFVALKRLGKQAWLLNYQGEPHWVMKTQNRVDFAIRMAQFFDHYLKDAPLPVWMRSGVPATEESITSGLELSKD